jgi:hypothetical protein
MIREFGWLVRSVVSSIGLLAIRLRRDSSGWGEWKESVCESERETEGRGRRGIERDRDRERERDRKGSREERIEGE